jgi:hypothetical protein
MGIQFHFQEAAYFLPLNMTFDVVPKVAANYQAFLRHQK